MINFFDDIASLFGKYQLSLLSVPLNIKEKVTDISLHVGFTPTLFMGKERYILTGIEALTEVEMGEIIFKLCDYSMYKHVEEIKNGFISAKGKYRVGICGTAVINNGEIDNIKNILSITARVPHMIYGAAEDLVSKAGDLYKGILLVGEPSSGKTTILKDLITILSEKRIVILDERFELTGVNFGKNIDILSAYPKPIAISHAIRNLGAEIIICDELEKKDLDAIETCVSSGISIIATVHGTMTNTIRPIILELVQTGAFSKIAFLKGRESPCEIRKVWEAGVLLETCRSNNNNFSRNLYRSYKSTRIEPKNRGIKDIP